MAKAKTKTTAKAKAKKKRPRQRMVTTSLTDRIIDELAGHVRRGNFRYVARQRVGVAEGTFRSWLSRGRQDREEGVDSQQAKLLRALEEAEGEAHAQLVQDVVESDNVKVKAEFMYRRYGKLYSKNPNAHDDDTGETVRVNPLELLAEKLKPFVVDDDDEGSE